MKNVLLIAAALSAIVAGCDLETDTAPAGAVASDSQELTGSVIFLDSSCSSTQKNQIRRAMAIAASQILVNGDSFQACLQDSIASDAEGSFAEDMVDQLAQNMPSLFYCGPRANVCSGGSTTNACAPVGVSYEKLTFTDEFLSAQLPAAVDGDRRVASVLLHEIIHNKGFSHNAGYEYKYSVNEQVEWCSLQLSNYSFVSSMPNANGMEYRDTMQTEVELHPVGGIGGSPDDGVCNEGALVVALGTSVWSPSSSLTDWIRRVQLRCRDNGHTTTHTRRIGSGGTLRWDACTGDEVAIGVQGRASDSKISRLGLVCGNYATLQNGGTPTPRHLPTRGGWGGTTIERSCPAGMAVRAVLGRAGGQVNQLRLVCRDVTAPTAPHSYNLSSITSASAGYSSKTTRRNCTDNGLMVGLYGAADVSIARLGGICRGAEYTRGFRGTPWFRLRAAADRHVFPANGGARDSSFQSTIPNGWSLTGRLYCNANEALVGIKSGSGMYGDIGHVQGVCANIDAWRTQLNPTTTNLNRFGIRDNEETRTCPKGKFMVGLEVRSRINSILSRRTVQRIKPRCRFFGNQFSGAIMKL